MTAATNRNHLSASPTHLAALNVMQLGVSLLANWANAKLPFASVQPEQAIVKAVSRAKELLKWTAAINIEPLRLLFDLIQLTEPERISKTHYWKLEKISDREPSIPYPQSQLPTQADISAYQQEVKEALEQLKPSDGNNISLLTLVLEKYSSCLSFNELDTAFIDLVRSAAAVAAVFAQEPEATHLSLVTGDLSGIQNFIYTISSDGALKSLRARSFFLELVTEEVVQQLLEKLNLPRTNVIYAGGGNLYILAAVTEETSQAIAQVREQLNGWLFKQFQGKVFLALDCSEFKAEDLKSNQFACRWQEATKKLAEHKSRKFSKQINYVIAAKPAHEPCKVCHRDDVRSLSPLNSQEADSVLACGTCRRLYHLGGQLLKVQAIVRSRKPVSQKRLHLNFPSGAIYYNLFDDPRQAIDSADSNLVLLVNNWTVRDYQSNNTALLLLGNYGEQSKVEPNSSIRASEMADVAEGIKRVGYLRMDVDRLGQIFAKGLGEKQNLPRLAGLSRLMSYFFKVYLNSLAKFRHSNFLSQADVLTNAKWLSQSARLNLFFIYAGGDDLFVSGTWNEVVEFAFDIYQCFRAYTGYNPNITLSGGINLAVPKFPLYQAAETSDDAEKAAKNNGRDSLGLFGEIFKWDEWLGTANLRDINPDIDRYLQPENQPPLFGIFPFVEQLKHQLEISVSRSFVRNLLATAQIQKQMIEAAKDKSQDEQQDIRYFLHLPKVAYTLARLPNQVRNHPQFEPIRASLKSPYNAPYFRAIATWIELLNRSSSSKDL